MSSHLIWPRIIHLMIRSDTKVEIPRRIHSSSDSIDEIENEIFIIIFQTAEACSVLLPLERQIGIGRSEERGLSPVFSSRLIYSGPEILNDREARMP